ALVARAPAGPGSGLGAAASAALARSLRRRWRATGVLHSLSSRCEPRLLLLRSAATVAPSSADSANATAATSTEATAAAKPEGAAVSSADSPGTGEKKEEKPEKKPMGWGMFMVYVSGGIGGLTFLYYFYKANYSLHKTEILMLEAFRQLPLYSPPGPSTAELNSRLDGTDLPQDLVQGLAEWFVAIDLQEPGGVSRDDVLELMGEFGFGEEEKPAKDFLFRGEGQIEERRRLTCAGLQETVTLVTDLVANEAKKIEKEKNEVPDPDFPEPPRKIPKSMPEMVTVLEAKLKRTSFSMNSTERRAQIYLSMEYIASCLRATLEVAGAITNLHRQLLADRQEADMLVQQSLNRLEARLGTCEQAQGRCERRLAELAGVTRDLGD
ncbi:unnamed protein product, partial [Polarella glacialis]